MVRKVYELRFFHGTEALSKQQIMAVLDLDDDPDGAEALLNGHLFGAVVRAGGSRRSQHEFTLEVWAPPREGSSRPSNPEVRWALPATPEVF